VTCPGLHCPGCSGCRSGVARPVLAVAVFLLAGGGGAVIALEWLAERILWILGTAVLAVVLAVAAVLYLIRCQERREQAWGLRRAAAREVIYCDTEAVSQQARPQLDGRPVIIQNFYGTEAAEMAARVLPAALPADNEEN